VDTPTTNFLDALKHPGGSVLFSLLEGEATEADLCERIPDVSQPTLNRALWQLHGLGLVAREEGPKQAKGLRWSLLAPDETHNAFLAVTRLVQLSLRGQEESRARTELRLAKARGERQLRDVSLGA
jgi:DNA-binding HxlR family transcriptional regulator